MATRSALVFGGLLAVSTAANAQGYFSFGEIPGVDMKPTIQIDMNSAMLSFVSEAAKAAGAEPDAAAALAGITHVRVYVYEGISDDLLDVLKFVDATSESLERDGWHAVVRVRENDEQVRVYMKPAAPGSDVAPGSLAGLTLMVTDGGAGDEAVFINVAGVIQPAQLGRIAAAIGMDGMFNMVPGVGAQNVP